MMQVSGLVRRSGRLLFLLATLLGMSIVSGIGIAQPYSSQPIKIIVPYTPGTGNDILARVLSQRITERWKTPVVVENRAGASGNIGTAAVARSTPDGLTLLVAPNNFVINPYVFKDAQYDPFKDFEPVALLGWGRLLLVANPATKLPNVRALVDAAKAKPGQFTYASPGAGTPHHVSMELFKVVTGIDLLHIPYKGSAGAVTDVIAGNVNIMFLPIHVALPYVKEGRLLVLGLGSEKRSPNAPDIPTLAEQGIKGAEVDIWYALFAPAGTPRDIVRRLHLVVNEILDAQDTKGVLAKQGLEVETVSIEAFKSMMERDSVRWGQVARTAKLTAD
jgi:tripartite-type tricarboxylate transporter receptor subunit TctC